MVPTLVWANVRTEIFWGTMGKAALYPPRKEFPALLAETFARREPNCLRMMAVFPRIAIEVIVVGELCG